MRIRQTSTSGRRLRTSF